MLGQQRADPGHEGGHGGVAGERHLTGDALVEHDGQAVDVGLAVQGPPLHLLGRRVAGRPQDGPVGLGPGCLGQGAGQAEVGDPEPAVGVEEEVGRLDVAVDQAAPVGVVQPGGGLEPDVDRLLGGEEPTGVVDLAQAAAGQVLQHQVGGAVLLAPVVDLEDVGMVEGGHRPRLGPEALEEGGVAGQCRVEHLDRHPAVERDVVGQVDVRGRARTQGGHESVPVAEDPPDGVGDARHRSASSVPTVPPPAVEGDPTWGFREPGAAPRSGGASRTPRRRPSAPPAARPW